MFYARYLLYIVGVLSIIYEHKILKVFLIINNHNNIQYVDHNKRYLYDTNYNNTIVYMPLKMALKLNSFGRGDTKNQCKGIEKSVHHWSPL